MNQTNGRAALVKGMHVGKEVFDQALNEYFDTGMYQGYGIPIWGVPKNKDMKLLSKFAAKET